MTMITSEPRTLAQQAGLNDLLARYIAFVDAKPKTVQSYKSAIRQFTSYLADNGIRQPQRADILAYREGLLSTAKPTTVQAYMVAIRLFFRWTAQEGLYPNVADNIKGAKLDKNYKKDYLTSAQIKAVLAGINRDNLQGLRDYAIMAVMTAGGLRCIEVNRANVEDIGTAGDSTVLYLQGKGRDEKTEYIKLPQPVEMAIRAYLKARGKVQGKEPLFASISNNSAGGRMTTRSISGLVKSHLIAAGFDSERLTAHSLRHTAGNLALNDDGSNYAEVQQFMRHGSVNTTMIYVRQKQRASNRSEARIAAAIF